MPAAVPHRINWGLCFPVHLLSLSKPVSFILSIGTDPENSPPITGLDANLCLRACFLGNLNCNGAKTILQLQVSNSFNSLSSTLVFTMSYPILLFWSSQKPLLLHTARTLPFSFIIEGAVRILVASYLSSSIPLHQIPFSEHSLCSVYSLAFPVLVRAHDQFPIWINGPAPLP